MEKGKGLYPGCLAMIVRSCPENNGLFVVCVRPLQKLELYGQEGFRAACEGWLVRSEGRPIQIERRYDSTGAVVSREYRQEAPVPRQSLKPLGGPGIVTDETKEKEVPKKEDVY